MISNDVNKSGEMFLQTVLERSKGGLKLTIYASSKLEQFMAGINDGMDTVATRLYGREWHFLNPNDGMAYNTPGEDFLGPKYTTGGRYLYRLDTLGKPLLSGDDKSGLRVVNLSFLRLVGVSGGNGLSFEVKGVRTQDGIKELSGAIGLAAKTFYDQFIRDIKQVATVSEMAVPMVDNGNRDL